MPPELRQKWNATVPEEEFWKFDQNQNWFYIFCAHNNCVSSLSLISFHFTGLPMCFLFWEIWGWKVTKLNRVPLPLHRRKGNKTENGKSTRINNLKWCPKCPERKETLRRRRHSREFTRAQQRLNCDHRHHAHKWEGENEKSYPEQRNEE